MADPHPYRDSNDDTSMGTGHGSRTSRLRWVKVFGVVLIKIGIIALVLVLFRGLRIPLVAGHGAALLVLLVAAAVTLSVYRLRSTGRAAEAPRQWNSAASPLNAHKKGARSMHSFAHHHSEAGETSAKETRGLILNRGWRYDLEVWFFDTFLLRGRLRELRQRTADLARIQPGEKVLDVGCGTGTLAIEVQPRVGATGRVLGVDPGTRQIARARSKAARRNLPIEFQIGVIEDLDFPDQTFDVVLNTLMMHHLPDDLKRQGLSEIARVLKPGGRLVIADFERPEERQDRPARFGVGESGTQDLPGLIKDAGFSRVETEKLRLPRLSARLHPLSGPGVVFVRAHKS
jgi:SAM-dependent methyltransferase